MPGANLSFPHMLEGGAELARPVSPKLLAGLRMASLETVRTCQSSFIIDALRSDIDSGGLIGKRLAG